MEKADMGGDARAMLRWGVESDEPLTIHASPNSLRLLEERSLRPRTIPLESAFQKRGFLAVRRGTDSRCRSARFSIARAHRDGKTEIGVRIRVKSMMESQSQIGR